ncbi:MAG: hypothetical protein K1W14_03335 [Muribaculaceae bacterium]|jgi:hypothetical protein
MKTISITLDLNEIIYDIQNKTYLTGRSRHDGTNHEQVANMQANDDEESANQILRSVSIAFNTLKTKLGEYIDNNVLSGNNELLTRDSTLAIALQMPSNYNNATTDTIASAAHQYIVSTTVAEWFAITNKPDSQQYTALADVCLKVISEAINKRLRPVRICIEKSK